MLTIGRANIDSDLFPDDCGPRPPNLRRENLDTWIRILKKETNLCFNQGQWYRAPSSVLLLAAGYGKLEKGPAGPDWRNIGTKDGELPFPGRVLCENKWANRQADVLDCAGEE